MPLIANKKFHLNFEATETLEAGLELHGFEVKSVREKMGSLDGAYIKIRDGEAWLVNAYIPAYQPANAPEDYDPYRARKLLLTKKELSHLVGYEHQKRLTIVPKSLYNSNGKIKAEIVIAKGKKKADKRADIKKKDIQRDIDREMKDLGR